MEKIYKYTSINSAIKILKSEGVVLNNPINFNDPSDCSFFQSEKDKKKIDKLLDNYFIFFVIDKLISNNEIKLKRKFDMIIFSFLKWEFDLYKKYVRKFKVFENIPFFSLIKKVFSSINKDLNNRIESEKSNFNNLVKKAIDDEKNNALISCFSKRKDSILMRSHYANSHRGVCIEFERPNLEEFKDVVYKSNFPKIKLFKIVSHLLALKILNDKNNDLINFNNFDEVLKPFVVKSKDWKYENEVRCLYSKNVKNENLEFFDKYEILKMKKPTAIYIGCKAEGEELSELLSLASNRDIPTYAMKKSEKRFDIIVDKKITSEPLFFKSHTKNTLLLLISELENCLNNEIYLSAFAGALIIPAICSKVEIKENLPDIEKYIKWCDKFLSLCQEDPQRDGMPYISGEMLWKIKETLFKSGNVDISGDYYDFHLSEIHLIFEKRKYYEIYADSMSDHTVEINITKFCTDMIYQGNRCFKLHKEEMQKFKQIYVEYYDDEINRIKEMSLFNERIKNKKK